MSTPHVIVYAYTWGDGNTELEAVTDSGAELFHVSYGNLDRLSQMIRSDRPVILIQDDVQALLERGRVAVRAVGADPTVTFLDLTDCPAFEQDRPDWAVRLLNSVPAATRSLLLSQLESEFDVDPDEVAALQSCFAR
jgi:hypothetical protein